MTNVWTESVTAPTAAWAASASSSSGEYLYAVVDGGYIYSSITYGATWNSYLVLGESSWSSVACSSDGTYVVVCSSSGGVYLSDDNAISFSATNCPTAAWTDVAVSSTGDVMAAVGDGEYIYISLDYGDIWTPTVGTDGLYWKSVAMSSTGIYITAVVYEGSLYQSSNYGSSFTEYTGFDRTYYYTTYTVPFYFMAVDMSSTGQYAVAVTCPGTIYYTLDYGSSWAEAEVAAESDQCWSAVSLSSTGQYQLATEDSGYIYMTSEYGEIWVPSNDAPSDAWTSVASSSTGQYTIATVSDGPVYLGTIAIPSDTSSPTSKPTVITSDAYTWEVVISEDLTWSAVASDTTGQYLVACAAYDGIYLTTDGGLSWTASSVTVTTDFYWVSVASSSDGSIVAASALDDGYVIVSSDYGSTWNQNSGEGEWISVAISGSGSLIAAAEYYGGIYLSIDYGVTWSITAAPEPLYWTSVSMSSESSYMLGTCVDGYVYTSTDSGSDWSEVSGTPYGTKWKSSAVSETGQYMLALGAEIGIYYSLDYGTSWAISNAPSAPEWSYITSSSSGELGAAVSYSGFVYVTSTYGMQWEICTSLGSGNWLGVATDSSGSQLIVAGEDSGIYRGLNAAVPSAAPIVGVPSLAPTPTSEPTDAPIVTPSIMPTFAPTDAPTVAPSVAPSVVPTATVGPSQYPTSRPSSFPTEHPVAGPTKRPNTPAPSFKPSEFPTSRPTSAPIIPTLFPTALPSTTHAPTREPSIQNSPIVTFSVNVTLTKLTSDVLNVNCQNAIIATTAYWMQVPSTAIIYIGSYPVPVVRRLEMGSGSSSSSGSGSSSSNVTTYSLIAVTRTSTSVAATSYSNSSNLYAECVKKLDTAVTNGDYTETLQIESQSQYYDAVATQSAVATLIAESVPEVIQEPTHEPTLAPTMSTAPGTLESIGTIVPGTILFILVITILYLRDPMKGALNELNSNVGEVMDAAVKCFIVILSVNLIAEYSSDTRSPSFLLLIFSKLALFGLWCFFILAFFFPVRTVDGKKRVQLALLLHKEPFKIKLSFSVYGLLVTMSVFDLTFLRLMPWIRTNLTDSMQGYPNTFMIRCCLYGTFLSHLIQSLAIIIKIVFESKSEGNGMHAQEDKEKAIILLAFSVFNVFRAFISMLFVVRVAQSDKLKLAVVNENDVAALADFMRKTEFQDSRGSSMDDGSYGGGSKNKKGFTPGRISTMLFNVAGFRSSTVVTTDKNGNTTENPLNKSKDDVRDESFVMSDSETNRIVSDDFKTSEGEGSGGSRYVQKRRSESVFSDMTGESGEVDERGIRFSASTKFADQTLEILRSQLKKEGKIPVEFIPLAELKAEIAVIFSKANNGVPYDEARLDYLLMCMDFNPEYKAEKELETKRWRNEIGPFASDCLEMMRGFVPPFVFHASQESLVNEYGMSKELAKRIIMKKCLWLVRVSVADIDRMHIAELLGRFNPEAQGLDIVEIAAIFQAIPEKFGNDPDGKKERWRASLEQNLKNLVTEKASGTLMKSKARNPAYNNQTPPFAHRESMHEMNVTSGEDAFKPRSSFRMLGARSSLTMFGGTGGGGGSGAISSGTVQQQQLESARNSEVADELSPLPRASITNLNSGGGTGLPPAARPSITGRPTRAGSLRGSIIGDALNKIFANNLNSSGGSVKTSSSDSSSVNEQL